MTSRRAFMTTLASVVLVAPLAGEVQPAGKTPRLSYVTSTIRTGYVEAFEQGLRQLGYTIGENIMGEYRFGEGRDRVPALVDELLRLGVDVLFAANPYVIRAARHATSTVPIVGVDLETDPIQVGWVKSLAKPGDNLTGLFSTSRN